MRSVLKQEPKKWAEPLEAEAPNISEAPRLETAARELRSTLMTRSILSLAL